MRISVASSPAAAVVILLFGFSSYAQGVNPFPGYRGPLLTKVDLDEGTKAAGRLLGNDPKPVGATEAWSGPRSGNSGTLTVERVYQRHGQPCRTVMSQVTYKDQTHRSFLLSTCRVADHWKLM